MFTSKEQEYTVRFTGDSAVALEVARTALLGHGFEIVSSSSEALLAIGPGMSSTNQPALCGASEISFLVNASTIEVRAQFGGVQKMKLFLLFFPPGLGLVLAGSFALAGMAHSWAVLGSIAPWLLLSPLMAAWLDRRTDKAIDRLVRSMVQVAKRD